MATRTLVIGAAVVLGAALATNAAATEEPMISVRERDGVYRVTASFDVPETPEVVREVITDYPSIPRFLPDVRTSDVLEREAGYALVEQEAVSRFMLFSRRIHLVLRVEEGADRIRFRDTCNRSFVQYEGGWTMTRDDMRTHVVYELTARPAFNVPALILRKLLDRDASLMIERLRGEIRARARAR